MSILFFHPHDEYGWLSNFSNHAFLLDQQFWPTMEHYYQAQKFIKSPQLIAAILLNRSPKKVKGVARNNAIYIRQDWNMVKESVMAKGLYEKFNSHPKLTVLLKTTCKQELIENSQYDYYWGCGQNGNGQNRLGKLLMQIRDGQ